MQNNLDSNEIPSEIVKPLIKTEGTYKKEMKEGKKKKKCVVWDVKTLEEQELDRKIHPVLLKCTEPKTPYTPYEEGDDEYLKKLNEVNKLEPTADVLNNVIDKLQVKPIRKTSQEFLEIEVINQDGTVTKELVDENNQCSKEFAKKRKKAYQNEFIDAKKFYDEHNNEDSVDQDKSKKLIETTLNNTLINKFSGKVKQLQIEKEGKSNNENINNDENK